MIDSYIQGVFQGAFIVGLIIGAICFFYAAIKNQYGRGFASFVICIVAALIGGLLIGIPVGAGMIIWINKGCKSDAKTTEP